MVALTGPRSSTGSPITLRMRPRVALPTGTVMGPPVSKHCMPRTMPSVDSMATAADAAAADVLLDLENDVDGMRNNEAVARDAQRLINRRHRCLFKLHIDRRTGNLNHFAYVFCHKCLSV